MALVVEDGTGVVGAESYASVADATAYWAKRPQNANAQTWATSTAPVREGALREASEYLDATWGRGFAGIRLRATQGRLWPRVTVAEPQRYHRFNLSDYSCWPDWLAAWPEAEPVAVAGFDGLALALVPAQIVQATIELAARAVSGPLAEDVGAQGRFISRTAGGSSIEYAEGQATMDATYGIVARLLAPLLEDGGSWAWR